MSRPGCAICGSDKARYEANHGPSGPFSVVPPEPHPADSDLPTSQAGTSGAENHPNRTHEGEER